MDTKCVILEMSLMLELDIADWTVATVVGFQLFQMLAPNMLSEIPRGIELVEKLIHVRIIWR